MEFLYKFQLVVCFCKCGQSGFNINGNVKSQNDFEEEQHLKTYIAVLMKGVRYWHLGRQLNHRSKIESPEIDFHLYQHLTQGIYDTVLRRKMGFSINNSGLIEYYYKKWFLTQTSYHTQKSCTSAL